VGKDYYKLLGVKRSAPSSDIRRAYRKLARTFHPDVNPDNPQAEQNFKEIGEAYEVLSNSTSRSQYDKFGQAWKQGNSRPYRNNAQDAGAFPGFQRDSNMNANRRAFYKNFNQTPGGRQSSAGNFYSLSASTTLRTSTPRFPAGTAAAAPAAAPAAPETSARRIFH